MDSDARALAEAHWGYVKAVLLAHDEWPEIVEKCGFHYKSAFEHGYKHGVEAASRPTIEEMLLKMGMRT